MTQISKELSITHSADKLIEEYYLQSEAIIAKGKVADRLLTLTETKKLKELATAIKGLECTINPGATMAIFARFMDYTNEIDHNFTLKLMGFMSSYLRDELKVAVST